MFLIVQTVCGMYIMSLTCALADLVAGMLVFPTRASDELRSTYATILRVSPATAMLDVLRAVTCYLPLPLPLTTLVRRLQETVRCCLWSWL